MNIYLKAAEACAISDFFSCNRIEMCGGTRKQKERYAELFHPEGRTADSSWLHRVKTGDLTIIRAPIAKRDRKKFRILALCLMAAIVSYRRKRK